MPERRLARDNRLSVLAAVAWVAVVLLIDAWWLHRFRPSAPPEYDESGYMAIALRDFHALKANGITGLVSAYVHQVPEAPLVPVITVIPYLILGAGTGTSIVTPMVAVAGLAFATYALAQRMVSRGWAAVAASVSVSLPVVSDFSRTFHFAVPAAALFTAAAWVLARSDGLSSRRWALAAGALTGCTVLSRTMTLAYLPGIGAAALLLCLRAGELRRKLESLGLFVAATVVVAATWYAPNGNYRSVSHYLVGSGYGGAAARYGKSYSPLSADYWLKQARVTVTYELYAPIAIALLACVVVLLASTRWRNVNPRASFIRLARSDIAIPLLIVIEGYLALTSSRNIGTAFSLPWLPSLSVLCVACAARVRSRSARGALAAALVLASAFNVLMKSDAIGFLAARKQLRIPGFATVPVTDGNWIARMDVAGDGYRLPPSSDPLPQMHRHWLPFAEREASAVLAAAKKRHITPKVLVATGDSILSTTRFSLGAELNDRQLPAQALVPEESSSGYERQMRDPALTLLVTAAPPPSGSVYVRSELLRAARAVGFRRFRASTAPDGRQVIWWWRTGPA
jgi:4-amino-4-deoxy-L-arabinose transferase-like glycosyltransferase